MKSILITMALVLAAQPLRAQQWTPTGGPEGAEIVSMAASGITALAVTAPGVLYRHNGAEWTRLGPTDLQRLYSIGNTFIATSYDALLRSTDQGSHWQPAPIGGSLFKVVVDGGMLYAGTAEGIYRSSDEGRTWTVLARPDMDFYSLYVSGSTMFVGRGNGQGLFRSIDTGRSWNRVVAGLPPGAGADAFGRIGDTLYAAFGPSGIYRSNDDGASWRPVNEGLPGAEGNRPPVSSLLAVGDRIWAAASDGVYIHDGARWTMKARSLGNTFAKGDGFIYHGTDVGVSATTDSGMSWFSIDRGLHAHRVGALASFNGAVYASGGGAIHVTTDNGLSWERSAMVGVGRFAVGNGAIYALGRQTISPGIFRATVDGGWERIGDSLPYSAAFLGTISASGDTIFAGYHRAGWDSASYWRYGGIVRSTDRGTTWSAVNTGLPHDGHGFVLVIDIIQADGAVLAMTVDGLYRSSDGGERWNRLDATIPGENNHGILAAGNGRIYLGGTNFVIVSSDGGRTWGSAGAGIPPESFIHHLQFIKGVLYITLSDGKDVGRVFGLVDGRWVEITGRFPAEVHFETFIEAGNVVLGGTQWNSVWRGSIDAPAGVDEGREENDGEELSASPNPFISGMVVDFTLDRGGEGRLRLVAPNGEDAGILYRGTLRAGRHRVPLDGAGLAAGAYRLRLETGDRVVSVGVVKVR